MKVVEKTERETIIIFQSDNGANSENGCNFPYRGGKSNADEGGTLSPTFVYRTHQPFSVSRTSNLLHIVDWFPTILAFANITAPSGLDGVNQVDMFYEKNVTPARENLIYAWQDKYVVNSSIDHGDWALSDLTLGG